MNDESPRLPDLLPVLPLKDAVLYPYIIVPLSIGRESSIQAVDAAISEHRLLALVARFQIDSNLAGAKHQPGDLLAPIRRAGIVEHGLEAARHEIPERARRRGIAQEALRRHQHQRPRIGIEPRRLP